MPDRILSGREIIGQASLTNAAASSAAANSYLGDKIVVPIFAIAQGVFAAWGSRLVGR